MEMIQLLKTRSLREHYLEFAQKVSKVILDNHQLSPYKSESSSNHDSSGWETVQNCEQLLSLTQAMCEEAKQISSRLSDKSLRSTLVNSALGALDACRNLLMLSQDKYTEGYSHEKAETFIQSCQGAQHKYLTLVVAVERADEQKVLRSAEWCMEKAVLLETEENSSEAMSALQNFSEANEVFMQLVSSRVQETIDVQMKSTLEQALKLLKQTVKMLETAVRDSFNPSSNPETSKKLEGREFAVNRTLQAMGKVLELIQQSPNIEQTMQTEAHFFTVMQQMLDVLQPEKRFDFLGNLSIDVEAALRHVMMMAYTIYDVETKTNLMQTSTQLLENVKNVENARILAENSAQEREVFMLACEEMISNLGQLNELVKQVTVENLMDGFVNFSVPSKQLQDMANHLSQTPGLSEEQCTDELQKTMNEFRIVNKTITHAASLTLAAFPYTEDSQIIAESLFALQQCALDLESEAMLHALSPGTQSAEVNKGQLTSSLSLCRRSWELNCVNVKKYLHDLVGRVFLVEKIAKVCRRDFTFLRTVCSRKQISLDSDELLARLTQRLAGLCLVSNEIADKSSDALFRNGLLALGNQVVKAVNRLNQSYQLFQSTKNDSSKSSSTLKQACDQLAEQSRLAEECMNRLEIGLERGRQPGILNPIRREVRRRGRKDEDEVDDASIVHPSLISSLFESSVPESLIGDYGISVFGAKQPNKTNKGKPFKEKKLAKLALDKLNSKNEAALKQVTNELSKKLTNQARLLREYASLAPTSEKTRKLKKEAEECEEQVNKLNQLAAEVDLTDSRRCEEIESVLQKLQNQEDSMVSNKTVGDIQGPWRGPPTRLKRALDDKNVAEFAFAREDLRRITNEIAALAARSMPNSEDEDILDLKPGGSHNLDGSKEPDSAKLARSAQLMLSATDAIEDAKLDISEEQGALWAVRANCCFDQIDNLLSAQTISDLTSISNAITKGDVSFLNDKMPSLQAIATTQLKLASLTGLSLENPEVQMSFSKATEEFQTASQELLKRMSQLQSADLNSEKSENERRKENAMIKLRQWAFQLRDLEQMVETECGSVSFPVDKLITTAITQQTSKSLGIPDSKLSSAASSGNDLQSNADRLHADTAQLKKLVNDAFKNCPDSELKKKAMKAMGNLGHITAAIIEKSRELATGTENGEEGAQKNLLRQLRREWAVSALYLSNLAQTAPGLSEDQSDNIVARLRGEGFNQKKIKQSEISEDEIPREVQEGTQRTLNSANNNPFFKLTPAEKPSESEIQKSRRDELKENLADIMETSNIASQEAGMDQLGEEGEQEGEGENGPQYKNRVRRRSTMLSRRNTQTILQAADGLKKQVEQFVGLEDSEGTESVSNAMISAARKLAQQMHDLAEFTQHQPPLKTKEDFVHTAKAISANGHSILKWAKLIADRCIDQRGLARTLRDSCEPIAMLGTQLSVVASVKAVCPDKHETDDALVTNARNLIDAVSNTLIHTEACCIKGLKPKPEDEVENSDGHEAIKLAASWKRRLDQKRKHAASHLPVDSFGLRKTTLDRGGDASLRDYLKTP